MGLFDLSEIAQTDLAVMPRKMARKATVGEHREAGTARLYITKCMG